MAKTKAKKKTAPRKNKRPASKHTATAPDANLLADPSFTFHLKQSTTADLPARATPILDAASRRAILAGIHERLGGTRDLDAWVEGSPLVVVEFLDA